MAGTTPLNTIGEDFGEHNNIEIYIRELEEEYVKAKEQHNTIMYRLYAFYLAVLSILATIAVQNGISLYDFAVVSLQSTIIGFGSVYILHYLLKLYKNYGLYKSQDMWHILHEKT